MVSRNQLCRDAGGRAFQAQRTACGRALEGTGAVCLGNREKLQVILSSHGKEFGSNLKTNGANGKVKQKWDCFTFTFEKNTLAAL